MAQKRGPDKGGSGKKKDLTRSQQKFMAKKSTRKISQKFGRIRKAGFAIKKMTDKMTQGEQFVDFSDNSRAKYGAAEFHKNMLNGSLFNASSTTCAELSKIKAKEEGGRSSGCEWQRLKINSANDERSMRVLEDDARRAIEQLRRDGRLPDTPTFAVDIHLEERWDGERLVTRGVSEAQARINREARRRLRKERKLVRSKSSRGTSQFEAYIVLQCVDKGVQIVVACLRVDDLSNLARFISVLADKIKALGISRARLLLDREFFNEAGIEELIRTRFRWITPCRNTPAVKKALAKFAETGKKTGVVRMTITGEDGRQVQYWMRIEPRKKGEEDDGDEDGAAGSRKGRKLEPHERFIGFAVSHRSEKPRHYKKRRGIETRFKMVSNRRNKTSSTLPNARFLCIIYSLFASNVWVVINSVFWRRPSDYVPRISLAAVLSMSVRMLEIREPKPPP